MSKTLNMNISLKQRFANVKAGKTYRNELCGSYTKQQDRAIYYVEDGALRFVGWCDELVRSIRHIGWFTDRGPYGQDNVMRGCVYALPAKDGQRRLVAGYHFNGGDDKGATIDFSEVFDDESKAAHMADEHARVAADKECDYQAEERERMEAEEAEEARMANLVACHPPLYVE